MHPFGGTGGISVTQDMRAILQQPGYISIKKGGQRLRYLYQQSNKYFLPSSVVDLLPWYLCRFKHFYLNIALKIWLPLLLCAN
jgi:hypothetical protein